MQARFSRIFTRPQADLKSAPRTKNNQVTGARQTLPHVRSAVAAGTSENTGADMVHARLDDLTIDGKGRLQRGKALHTLTDCVRFNCTQYFFSLRHQQAQIAVQYFLLDR